ncbi:MAG: Na(+)-translocating NADH-quinone reductase subunit C [Thermoguttaceae bacterium]|nr:Na(+)-translocating NADH-quinone reductase subunit C [Thermoguttaceae bacterium]MCR5359497.1 Na(+)-translocating NADH-quinone reductase subunit C [Thermoguttaceae bacterium]
MGKDSIFKVFGVAAGVCLVCSILVSLTATSLKEKQKENMLLDKQVNVLKAAGLVELAAKPSAAEVKDLYSKIEPIVVDTKTGETVEGVDPEALDIQRQLKDPAASSEIPAKADIAGIKRVPNESVVYLVKDDAGKVSSVVLPVYGRGLWSTLYGFLALNSDLATVKNLTFYQHGETPGLGGEVQNPDKMAKWSGKTAYGPDGKPAVHFKKGTVSADDPNARYEVDGFSGATLTCNGVNNTVSYWLGENGFGPLLAKLKVDAAQ